MESGAEQSVVGECKDNAYEKETGRIMKRDLAPLVFKIGDGERFSLGVLYVCIPVPKGTHIQVHAHIVKEDIPLLIGIEVLHVESLNLDFGSMKTQT